jgi:hypothetical protein
LGSLLGLTIGQVRALPVPEFNRWKAFYALEPWGWWNTEIIVANLFSHLYNIANGGKKRVSPREFIRDLTNGEKEKLETEEVMANMTDEEKRNYIRECAIKAFGG